MHNVSGGGGEEEWEGAGKGGEAGHRSGDWELEIVVFCCSFS